MKSRRAILLKYGLGVGLSLLTAWGVLSTHGFSEAADAAQRYRLLCDAFFVPAALLLSAAALIFVSNHGIFNGVSYAARYVARMFVPSSGKRDESYGDYVRRKSEKGNITGYGFLVVTGCAFLAVALIFLVLFYRSFPG